MEQDVIELKQNTNDGKYVIKKLPGRPKAGEVTLTRGLTDDNSFEDWMQKSHFGKMADARKGGAVIVFDFEGSPIKRYKLDERLAEGPRDRHPQGRRHQRPDREADHHLRGHRGRVMQTRRLGARGRRRDGPPGRGHRTPLRTEFEFELPRGYVDAVGHGAPPRGHAPGHRPRRAGPPPRRPGPGEPGLPDGRAPGPGHHPARHARPTSTPGIVENLFASDLAFLQDLYRRVNQEGHTRAAVTCPACQHEFTVDVAGGRLGES